MRSSVLLLVVLGRSIVSIKRAILDVGVEFKMFVYHHVEIGYFGARNYWITVQQLLHTTTASDFSGNRVSTFELAHSAVVVMAS